MNSSDRKNLDNKAGYIEDALDQLDCAASDSIVYDAKKELASLVDEAEQSVDDARKEGHDEGYDEGHEEGRMELVEEMNLCPLCKYRLDCATGKKKKEHCDPTPL